MPEVSSKIKKLLSQHKSFKILDNGKVHCTLSGHEFPCKEEAITEYIGGKKYQRLLANHCDHLDEFKEFLELKRLGRSEKLHCTLTHRLLNNEASQVEKHVKGRRFQRELKRWKECKANGTTYKSLCKKGSTKKGDGGNDDDDEDEDRNDDDDMSDLYPGESVANATIENGDEEEDEDEDESADDNDDDTEMQDDKIDEEESKKDIIKKKPQIKRKKDLNTKPSKAKRFKTTK